MHDTNLLTSKSNINNRICIGSVIINWALNFCQNLTWKIYIIKVEHMTKFSWETVLYSVKKTPATLPLTFPLKLQQVYIKNSIDNNGISQ